MKLKYNKIDDVLVVEYSKDKIDDAYESDNMLIQVNEDKEPVLVEIFKASQFLNQAVKILLKSTKLASSL